MDITVIASYINKFEGKTPELNLIVRDIWLWFIEKNIHLSPPHVPGKII